MPRRTPIILVLIAILAGGCAQVTVTTAEEAEGIEIASGAVKRADRELYAALAQATAPPADPISLAIALKKTDPALLPGGPTAPPDTQYKVGAQRSFWTHNNSAFKFDYIQAELMHVSRYAYFWQHISSDPLNGGGQEATAEDWAAAGRSFDESYERVRAIFGEEAWPGLDGDPRLYVIHSDTLGKVGGYFGQADLLPVEVEPHSNEGEYFYISNTWSSGIASEYYNEVLAHEFQHMIQKNIDPNEDGWLNEAFSMLAQQLAGMRGDNFVTDFLVKTDQSLWYWGGGSEDYGQSYLYLDYLYEQLGEDFIRSLAAHTSNGLASIDAVLTAQGSERNADDFYADAMAAAFFNDSSQAGGRYAFVDAHLTPVRPRIEFETPGAVYVGRVEQYGGTDIMTLQGTGTRDVRFQSDARLQLIPAQPHSGTHFWWSNRQDSSFSTLTREVDLSSVDDATLTYWAWYDIEEDWDYAYVLASSDGGNHWTVLPSSSSRSTNPNGQNLGHGLTGRSGGGEEAAWVEEHVDLSGFAGSTILLRFAMQNDLSVNEPGIALDDLSISEIGWRDDAESGGADWEPGGFVLSHNFVPQIWRVRLVEQHTDGSLVAHDLEVENGKGRLKLDLSSVERVVVFVIGQTRFTTTPAAYRLDVSP